MRRSRSLESWGWYKVAAFSKVFLFLSILHSCSISHSLAVLFAFPFTSEPVLTFRHTPIYTTSQLLCSLQYPIYLRLTQCTHQQTNMKFSCVATALCALPLALGGVLQAEVIRRTNHGSEGHTNGHNAVHGNTGETSGGMATVVVVLWVNNGGGAETQKMNEPVTVTVDHANKVAAPAATHTVCPALSSSLE